MSTFRYSLRMLGKSPGFTAVAVIALGLGIGANTAIFSIADVLVYRPLVLPNLDRLVIVIGSYKRNLKAFDRVTPADFLDFRRDVKTIEHLAAATETNLNLTGSSEPERVSGSRVSAGFFAGLGAQPFLGRTFFDKEDSQGEGLVAVLSYGLWSRRMASDPNILARSIQLDGREYRVAGVMPKDFQYPPGTEIWVPLAADAREQGLRSAGVYTVVGRLKDGVSTNQAQAELSALSERISERFPESHNGSTARVELLREYVSGNYVTDFMRMLLGCVAFVLLIACSNVANLQFARVSLRSKEMAIRTALGASRLTLIGQFLTESVILGTLGGTLGLILAQWGLYLMRPALSAKVQVFLPGWSRLSINGHVLLFTLAAAVMAGILAGIAPAWIGSRADLNDTLKESGRGTSSGLRRHRLRGALVVGQVVMALILLVGAGLIAKGSRLITDPAPNLESSKALTLRLALSGAKYAKLPDVAAFEARLLQLMENLPGVTAAAMVSNLPYSGSSSSASFTIEGRDPRDTGGQPGAVNNRISPNFFRAFHLPMLSGRAFTDSDGRDAQRVAVVSRGLALRYFPGESPLGKHIKVGLPSESGDWMTIVGVVSDVRQNPFDKIYRPTMYRPVQQAPIRDFDVILRTTGNPGDLKSAVRSQLDFIDRDQPIFELKPLDELFDDQLSGFRFLSVLMDIFGLVALFLASIGVYAVMAYSVNERSHEIGVRMALGAREPDVLWLIVRRGLVLTGFGLLIGLPATLAIARLLANILFGVSEYDPATFATGLFVLSFAALLASYLPARKAARVDPVVTLRSE